MAVIIIQACSVHLKVKREGADFFMVLGSTSHI